MNDATFDTRSGRALTEQLKGKGRRRRERLGRLAASSSPARASRNDLLPPLDLVYVLLEDLRTPAPILVGKDKLGVHRIACGSATDPEIVQRLVQYDLPARLVLTDEPYNVKISGHVTGGGHREFAMASGEMTDAEFLAFNEAWMATAVPAFAMAASSAPLSAGVAC